MNSGDQYEIIGLCKISHSIKQPCSGRDDYKFSEMIGQKPLIATLAPNLIGHPYIALEK